MKLILFLLILSIIFIGCCDSRPYNKAEMCRDIYSDLSYAGTNRRTEAIKILDSLFYKCGCDTLR